MPDRRRPSWMDDLKDVLLRPSTLTVLAIVVLWTLAFSLEPVKRQFPFLIWAQYRFHQALGWLDWRKPPVQVTVVEIGNQEYWGQLKGRLPTRRDYLGTLIAHAAYAGARTITLDFRLLSTGRAGSDADAYQAEDHEMLHDIQYATLVCHVPVILGYGVVDNGNGKWRREPSIFTVNNGLPLCLPDGSTPEPGCVRFGHVNLPLDKRQIPLQMKAIDSEEPDDASGKYGDSLALATAIAYETVVPPKNKKIREENSIQDRLNTSKEWVYGRFTSEDKFEMLPAQLLFDPAFTQDQIVKRKCSDRVVLIGATWMKNSSGLGGPIEGYDSPVGEMPGVYFHGNYIEDLIGRQYKPGVPLWLGITIDLVIGLFLYYCYHRFGRKNQWKVLLIFFVPLVAAYVLFYIFNRYLDFVLPLGLCFVHLSWEHFRTYLELRQAMP